VDKPQAGLPAAGRVWGSKSNNKSRTNFKHAI